MSNREKQIKFWYQNPFIVLTLIFVVLRLMSFTHWSWWWCLTPLWGPLGFVIALSLLVLLAQSVLGVYRLIFWPKEKRKERRSIRNVIKALEAYANSLSERNS